MGITAGTTPHYGIYPTLLPGKIAPSVTKGTESAAIFLYGKRLYDPTTRYKNLLDLDRVLRQ